MQHHAEPVFKLCRTYVKKIYTCLPLLDKTLPDNLVVMKNEITKSIGTLIFRVALDFTFVMHGFQKAFLIGPAAEGPAFAKMGIPAPELSAYFTIGAELIGGALLILGLGTRFAAAAIAIAMAGAFIFVHINDPFITDQKTGAGFEYVFVLGMAAIIRLNRLSILPERIYHSFVYPPGRHRRRDGAFFIYRGFSPTQRSHDSHKVEIRSPQGIQIARRIQMFYRMRRAIIACPQWDSNPHWTDFKSAASANWAIGAKSKPARPLLRIALVCGFRRY